MEKIEYLISMKGEPGSIARKVEKFPEIFRIIEGSKEYSLVHKDGSARVYHTENSTVAVEIGVFRTSGKVTIHSRDARELRNTGDRLIGMLEGEYKIEKVVREFN